MGIFGKLFENSNPHRGALLPKPHASPNLQRLWNSFPESKKNYLRGILRDSDHDGVPDKFDCRPYNPAKQDEEDRIVKSIDKFNRAPYYRSRSDANSERNPLSDAAYRAEWEPMPENSKRRHPSEG